jgi:hypothetical protein
MAAWNVGAKRNVMPTVSSAPAASGPAMSTITPRASRTSAEPVLLLMARLPCFATLRPAPATMNAAVVEMLNVPRPSPPVPHVSTSPGYA